MQLISPLKRSKSGNKIIILSIRVERLSHRVQLPTITTHTTINPCVCCVCYQGQCIHIHTQAKLCRSSTGAVLCILEWENSRCNICNLFYYFAKSAALSDIFGGVLHGKEQVRTHEGHLLCFRIESCFNNTYSDSESQLLPVGFNFCFRGAGVVQGSHVTFGETF